MSRSTTSLCKYIYHNNILETNINKLKIQIVCNFSTYYWKQINFKFKYYVLLLHLDINWLNNIKLHNCLYKKSKRIEKNVYFIWIYINMKHLLAQVFPELVKWSDR